MSKTTTEDMIFSTTKQKTISYVEELLPPGWINTGRHIEPSEPEYHSSENESRIMQTESTGLLRDKLAQFIDSAEQIICIASFLIADSYIIQKLVNAADRGVRVYLLTASETQLFKDSPFYSEFEQERMQEHKQFLDRIAGHILVRTGENLHSKFVLIDPNTSNPRGFLLTSNVTSEALTRNIELGVNLSPREVKDLFKQFLIGFWEESESELLEPGSITKTRPWNKLQQKPNDTLFTINNHSTIKEKIKQLLGSTKSEIIVSTYGIELTNEITQSLIQKLKSGKIVKMLARPRPNKKTMEALTSLANHGADVRGHPWLHAKAVAVDTETGWSGMVMTANIEQHGLDDGFETGIAFNEEESEILKQILDNWYRNCPQQLIVNKNLGEVDGKIQLWIDNAFLEKTIRPKNTVNLGSFTVTSFEELSSYQPQIDKIKGDKSSMYHEITYTWINLPPKLPTAATKESTINGLDLYTHKGTAYLVVSKPSQIPEARIIASKHKAKLVIK